MTDTPGQSFKRSSGRSIDSRMSARKKELLEKEKEKEAEPDPEAARIKARQLVIERWLLFSVTGTIGVAAVIWLISISTQYWFIVKAPTEEGIYMTNHSRFFLYSKSGLFTICRYARKNATNHVVNYTRTELFFSVMSLIMMIMGFMFSIYTFRNPRYMFKRLAAGIHGLSAASVMVVIEVVINSIEYEKEKLPYVHPPGAYHYYHFSFYLAWVVFAMNLVAAITFLVYSKKRKRDKALTEEMAMADEPTIIGRINDPVHRAEALSYVSVPRDLPVLDDAPLAGQEIRIVRASEVGGPQDS